jgi:hypothetical protein
VSELIDKIEGLFHRPAAVTPQDPSAEDPAPVVAASPAVSSDLSATPNRTLLIHGYSATGTEFQKLGQKGVSLNRPIGDFWRLCEKRPFTPAEEMTRRPRPGSTTHSDRWVRPGTLTNYTILRELRAHGHYRKSIRPAVRCSLRFSRKAFAGCAE